MESFGDTVSYVLGLAFLVGAVILAAWLARTYLVNAGLTFLAPRERRTGLIEQTSIGGGRRLLLIRRDEVEHLVLVGGPIDILVETGIPAQPPLAPPPERDRRAASWPFKDDRIEIEREAGFAIPLKPRPVPGERMDIAEAYETAKASNGHDAAQADASRRQAETSKPARLAEPILDLSDAEEPEADRKPAKGEIAERIAAQIAQKTEV